MPGEVDRPWRGQGLPPSQDDFTKWMCHVVMTELLRFGVRIEQHTLHVVTEQGARVLLRILPDPGPARLELNEAGYRELGPLLGDVSAPATAPVSAPPPDNVSAQPRLSPLDRQVMDLLRRGETLKGETIARRLRRRRGDSYLRERLARLVELGLLANDGRGYRRVSGRASG